METGETDLVALPKAWRTFEHLKAQVNNPSFARQEAPIECTASHSPRRTATLVLFTFFTHHSTKRPRLDAVPSSEHINTASSATTQQGFQPRAGERARPACCTPALRRAVNKALEIVRASMGSVETHINDAAVLVLHVQFKLMNAALPAVARTSRRPPPAWHINGLCICEPVSRVYRAAKRASPLYPRSNTPPEERGLAATAADAQRSTWEQATHIGDVWCSGTTFCGIKLFWVSTESRGVGVAYAMVEAARRSVCYGYEVPPEHVAFSEPTLMGSRFALRYQQRDDFLVY
ncbi:hypothetical protein ABL78_5439 [Leptomonas seymouri]|uniref:N-acetyltransferase ESCO acetyl-transferase domain-containing protein n=1 Tax=Leptomonas seymouri TaxID=5684 RepID=A0A0N0P4N8_LEPSE|nr:hypothetical protein ABL78_5439 [Leptomonas seymouri]|eukprot:KPI85519.1 hypothetical protein ABL78_5439 [Leptomonas seymouri]